MLLACTNHATIFYAKQVPTDCNHDPNKKINQLAS